MTSQSIIQGIVLLLYLIAMVMVGFVFYKKNSTHSDYVLGGRGMNVWVTSLSAQASDILGVVYFDILYGLYIVNVCGRCEFV